MAKIKWRPEVNALTTPQSYKIRFVPGPPLESDELYGEIENDNPNYNQGLVKAVMDASMERIQKGLINGRPVNIADALIFTLSFTGKLDEPDSPLPDIEDMLHVRIRPTASFVREIWKAVQMERLPMTEKAPIITTVEDTRLRLNDVLYSGGVLEISGTDLLFDPLDGSGECVLEGTRSGRAVQAQYGPISSTGIVLVPDIPAQDEPWNNEYTLSISLRYTESGTPRSTTYRRRLRSPLVVDGFGESTGILTDHAASPYVSVLSGEVAAAGMVRVQVVLDRRDHELLFSLLDIRDQGAAGPEVSVMADGEYTLTGFSGSPVNSLALRVDDFAALIDMVQNHYAGRLVDILDERESG